MIHSLRTLLILLVFGSLPVAAQSQSCFEYSSDDRLILRDQGFHGPVTPVVRYSAIISQRDLYNSRGTRLTDFRAIMQQDRANVHKSRSVDSFMFEYADGSGSTRISEDLDGFFTSLENRSILSQARYYQYCVNGTHPEMLEREIERGQLNSAILGVTLFYHPLGGYGVLLSPAG